jgi:hypothetical protein
MGPRTGDTVEVRYTGIYSHRGGHKTTAGAATGFHVVEKVGREGAYVAAAAPPDAVVTVLRRYEPPEPPVRSIVRDRVTGHMWMRVESVDKLGRHWVPIDVNGSQIAWQNLTAVTGSPEVYLYSGTCG